MKLQTAQNEYEMKKTLIDEGEKTEILRRDSEKVKYVGNAIK
jgi:hypothetical protein